MFINFFFFIFGMQIHKFLQWVKGIYSNLPNHLPKIFEPRPPIRVKDLSEVNIEQLLLETFTLTPIQTEKKLADGTVVIVRLYYFLIFFGKTYHFTYIFIFFSTI